MNARASAAITLLLRLIRIGVRYSLTLAVFSAPAIFAQTCVLPPAGIVGWWQGEDNTTDLISGSSGTLEGNMTYATGEVGTAFSDDGNNGSAVSLGNPAALQLQNFTIECWISRADPTVVTRGGNTTGEIFGYGSGGYGLGILDSGTLFLTKIDYSNIQGGTPITDLNFHHVAVTYNGGYTVLYLDGEATYTVTNYNAGFGYYTSVAIGARGDNFGSAFFGEIDEVSLYNRALRPFEIQAIFNAGSSGKCAAPAPPVVNAIQPAAAFVTNGATTNFTAYAAGLPPLAYMWQFNGTNLASATNSTLSLANIQTNNAGNYTLVVSNASGSVTSAVATLVLEVPPSIVEQPVSQTVPTNSTVAFVVAAAGSDPLSYQWLFNGANLPGKTDYLLELTNVQAAAAGAYTVAITNGVGSVTSTPAALTVIFPPVIVAQPVSQTNSLGSNPRFSVSATGFTNLVYQWQFIGSNLVATNITGATNPVLELPDAQPANAGQYFVVITNSLGSAVSSNALLVLLSPSCDPAPSNLVAWWEGNGDARDAVSGSAGALNGSVTFAPGEVGQAFSINGSNGNAVVVGNSTNYQLTRFTIEAWIKRGDVTRATASGLGDGLIFSYGSGGYGFGILNNGTPFLTKVDASNVTGGTPIADLNFHHLAATFDGTDAILYVDGAAVYATNYPATFSYGTPVAIGARGDTLASPFLGEIDEVSLYSRALQPSEILGIYNATYLGKCPLPLSFTTPPTNQSIVVGSSVTLNAAFAGSGPVSLQWFFNGQTIAGATNSSLVMSNLTFFQAGNYSLTATGPAGPVTLSNFVLNLQEKPLLMNGGFETGDFTGWVTNDLAFATYPQLVHPSGFNPGFNFFLTAPPEGQSAATESFDGSGPGTNSIAQDVILPLGPASLTFDYRLAWDMSNYPGSTLPRNFNVSIQPKGGGQPLLVTNILTAPPGTLNFDTGPLAGSLDLTPYSGRGLRISFDAYIPENFTGPGFLQLDKVALTYSIPPILAINPSASNVVVSWPASPTNYTVQTNNSLLASNAWSSVNSNLISHGVTNYTVTFPLPASPTYYRLRYP
jgi:hypothetical protein